MTMSTEGPVRVGIAGQGRSGWGIHVRTIRGLPEQFRVVAVADPLAERQEQAHSELGCRAYTTFDDLLKDDEVEVVVVSSPNRLHAEHSQRALAAGKHVVCEKPFALAAADADATIAAARAAGKHVIPFQNRRYEPTFKKVREVVASGVLGELLLVRLCAHSFSRRWDWQTLLEFGGGQLANNGPHALDQAMTFVGPGTMELFADLRNGLSSGDGEDHAKVTMKGESGPTVDVEVSTVAAYAQERWTIFGTSGGLTGARGGLKWRYVDWSKMPPRPVDRNPTPDRSYNREQLTWAEETWEAPSGGEGDNALFYADLYRTLREGAAPAIKAEEARRYVEVLERCRARYTPAKAKAALGSEA
ncbi:MAG TPA: Gfo/Idh/MocA family oxidoreductase [Chloroflexota bacterium]|nr:Gfo/Idh/MocA family oxidoreductase [Chloroflexota bacterium]